MCLLIATTISAQDITTTNERGRKVDSSLNLTPKQMESYTNSIDKKATSISKQVEKTNAKALKNLKRQTQQLQQRLNRIDSNLAKQVFANSGDRLQQLTDKLQQKTSKLNQLQTLTSSKDYLPLVDTFATSLKFLEGKLDASGLTNQATKALSSVKGLESQLQNATQIKDYIQQQKQAIQAAFSQYNLGSSLQSFNKQAYYYQQQIQEYKQLLKNPDKLEERAIAELTKSAFFKDFMQHNSQLASLFPIPQGYGTAQALAGLQTRASVNQILQSRLGTIPSTTTSGGGQSPQSYLQQQIQQGQNQLNAIKEKINKAGGSSSDLNMPDGFKPNTQKTKRFLDRLEYGFNVQNGKTNQWLPTTSDLALTVGYKLNDKSTIGIGFSYKLGLGNGLNDIKLSNQGIGLRSFLDVKLKGNIWIVGGYEKNYLPDLQHILSVLAPTGNWGAWQQSGLIGISKKYIVGKKKGNLQLLYDLLNKQNIPHSQAFIFRIGYGF